MKRVLWTATFLLCLGLAIGLLITGNAASKEVGQNLTSILAFSFGGVAVAGLLISLMGMIYSFVP